MFHFVETVEFDNDLSLHLFCYPLYTTIFRHGVGIQKGAYFQDETCLQVLLSYYAYLENIQSVSNHPRQTDEERKRLNANAQQC